MIFEMTGLAYMERNDEEAYVRCVENLLIPWILENKDIIVLSRSERFTQDYFFKKHHILYIWSQYNVKVNRPREYVSGHAQTVRRRSTSLGYLPSFAWG